MESGHYLRHAIHRLDRKTDSKASRSNRRSKALRMGDLFKTGSATGKETSAESPDRTEGVQSKVARVRSPKLREGAKMKIKIKAAPSSISSGEGEKN
jgi:hypothetical protein